MHYKVTVTERAFEDLDNIIGYLLFRFNNAQAASGVLDDFDQTTAMLADCAGSLKLCENPSLKSLGYRRINFCRHDYFMLYRLEGDTAVVDAVFHFLQDYESRMN